MRVIDRDLIRGGHYDQRSCEPRKQAEHMAAPTNAALVKKALANSEPSTHGTSETSGDDARRSARKGNPDIEARSSKDRNLPVAGLVIVNPRPPARFQRRLLLSGDSE